MENQREGIQEFFKLYKPKKAKRGLAPLLSPLEAALIQNQFQPFVFNYNGNGVYINAYRCLQIQKLLAERIELFAAIAEKENHSLEIPYELRDTFDNPAELLALPKNTREQLAKLEVYSMFSIMRFGKKHFVDLPGFGQPAVKALDQLFKKYKCSHVFK